MAYTLVDFNDDSLAVVASTAVTALETGSIVLWTLGTSALWIGVNAGRRAQRITRLRCSNAEVCLDGDDCRTGIE